MLSSLAFVCIIETTNLISLGISDHKQETSVPLLSKHRSYACAYSPMVSHAVAQKITVQPL